MDADSSKETLLRSCLESLGLDELAEEAGWSLKSRKVRALEWCLALCAASALKAPSLRLAAHCLGLVSALTVSPQAMHKRLLGGGGRLLGRALEAAIAAKARCGSAAGLGGFARVLIQDSTSVALPAALAGSFPGSRNQSGAAVAIMKIQAVYDMAANRFARFSLSGFTRNDQAAAMDVVALAGRGDLVLRDLGYFTLESLAAIDAKGARFLSRLRSDVGLYDAETGEQVDLLALLRQRGRLDGSFLAGAESRLRLRVLAVPLKQEVASRRRQKAKGNRDRRRRPDARTLELLGWQIMLTNCGEDLLPASKAFEIYAMRWRIETIFKAWKSGLGIGRFATHTSAEMAEAVVQAALLRVTLVHAVLIPWLEERDPTRQVSVVKLMDLIEISAGFAGDDPLANQNVLENLSRHCRYDKRKRDNTLERWDRLVSDMEELS